MQLVCDDCASTSQPTRLCEACGEVEGCRHNMRKYKVRVVGHEWHERIACENWAGCIMRCAKKVHKGGVMARLYSVELEKRFTIMVLADSKEHACEVAITNADDESQNSDREWTAFGPQEMTNGDKVPSEWRGSIPWAERDVNDDELTVEQCLGVEVK